MELAKMVQLGAYPFTMLRDRYAPSSELYLFLVFIQFICKSDILVDVCL